MPESNAIWTCLHVLEMFLITLFDNKNSFVCVCLQLFWYRRWQSVLSLARRTWFNSSTGQFFSAVFHSNIIFVFCYVRIHAPSLLLWHLKQFTHVLPTINCQWIKDGLVGRLEFISIISYEKMNISGGFLKNVSQNRIRYNKHIIEKGLLYSLTPCALCWCYFRV